jgi:hypothetical protein
LYRSAATPFLLLRRIWGQVLYFNMMGIRIASEKPMAKSVIDIRMLKYKT